MVFTFKKIRETIDAFKSNKKLENQGQYPQIPEYMPAGIESKPNRALNIGVIIIVTFPFLWLFNYLFGLIIKSYGTVTATGLSAAILSFLYGFVHSFFQNNMRARLFQKIPLYKLNPYFGNKLQETIQAFRKSKNR